MISAVIITAVISFVLGFEIGARVFEKLVTDRA